METYNSKGLFYLPTDKEKKVPGIITFSIDNGTNVDLIGILSHPNSENLIVQGHTSTGDSLTLYRTFYTGFTFGSRGFNTCNLYSRYLFKGLQFESTNDLYFRKIEVNLNLLTDWLNTRKSFDIEIDKNTRTTTIKDKPTDKIEALLPNDITLGIYFYSTSKFNGIPIKEAIIKQENSIEFKCNKRIGFELLMDLTKHFQNFLTFVTLKTIYPTKVKIFFRLKGEKEFRNAELLFPISFPKEYDSNKLHPYDFVVPFTSIETKFDFIIYRWFKLREKLHPIISEFCSVYYTPNMYPEDQFLSITRCLESFHRDFRNHRKLNNIDRYLQLYKEGRITFYKILKVKSAIKFCERLKTVRNNLTHNNPRTKRWNNKSTELLLLTEKARIIFISALLRDLGLTNKEISNLFALSRSLTFK